MNHHFSIPDALKAWLDIVERYEAPYVYTYWAAIAATSAVMGRKVALSYMGNDLFANMYILLVGDPACKKSTVISQASEFLRRAGYVNFAPDNTNKGALVKELMTGKHRQRQGKLKATKRVSTVAEWADIPPALSRAAIAAQLNEHIEKQTMRNRSVEDDAVIADVLNLDIEGEDDLDFEAAKEEIKQSKGDMAIWTDEFQQLFGRSAFEALMLLQKLWDCPYEHQTPEGIIHEPYLSIFSAINPQAFAKVFEPKDISQGLLPRMILVSAQPSGRRLSPFNVIKRLDLEDKIVDMLVRAGKLEGSMYLSREATMLYSKIAAAITSDVVAEDSRFVHYSQRRNVQLIKMAMALEAMNGNLEISVHTLRLAHTILCYTETSMGEALGEYGLAKDMYISQSILTVLGSAQNGVSIRELTKRVRTSAGDTTEVVLTLHRLKRAGKVHFEGEDVKSVVYKVEPSFAKWSPHFGELVDPMLLPEWAARLGGMNE